MFSRAIFIYTLKRVLKNYMIYLVAFGFVIILPLGSLAEQASTPLKLDATASYTCSLLFGLSLIVSQNIAGSVSSQSGGSDYLPLILSRPLSRAQYVFTKWITLSLLICIVSILQFCFLFVCSFLRPHDPVSPLIMWCGFLERILDAFSISISLVLVSLLPTRQMFGIGIIALELVGLNHLVFDFDVYTTSVNLIPSSFARAGLSDWLQHHVINILPLSDVTDAIKLGLAVISSCLDVIGPRFYIFDFVTNSDFDVLTLLTYLLNLCIGLILCLLLINTRDFNYAAE